MEFSSAYRHAGISMVTPFCRQSKARASSEHPLRRESRISIYGNQSGIAFHKLRNKTPTAVTAPVPKPRRLERLGISEVCTMLIHLYFNCSAFNPICSWMSAEGHHAMPASPLRATPHIAGDNYHGSITGDTVIVGGRGNTIINNLGQGESFSSSRYLTISCRCPALKRCPRN